MNHILLSDLIYRERLEKKPTTFTRLDEILHDDFGTLRDAHAAQDEWYVGFCDALDPAELDGTLSFDTVETGSTSACRSGAASPTSSSTRSTTGARPTTCCPTPASTPPPLDFIKFSSGE